MKWNEINNRVKNCDPINLLTYFYSGGTYLNLPLMLVHNKVLPLTLGESIVFDSEDEKIVKVLNEWQEKTQLHKKIRLLLVNQSFFGKAIGLLLKDKSGFLDLYIPQQSMMNYVAKVNEIDKVAVIWTNLSKGDSPSWAKITIVPGKVVIQYFGSEELRATDESFDYKKIEEFPVGEPQVYQLTENYFPLKEFINKQTTDYGLFNNSVFSGIPDWWTGRKLLFDIEDSLEQKYKERLKNQTRILGSLDQSKLHDIQKKNIDLEDLLGDLFLEANTSAYQNGGGNTVSAIQGNPPLDIYHKDIASTITLFYETAGYNYRPQDTDGEYENKTKSIMNNDLDIQTTSMKQKELLNGLYYLIDIVLSEAGYPQTPGDRSYSIHFNSSSIVDNIKKLDVIERRLAVGLMSRVEALQLLDGINKLTAKEKLEEINNDMLEKQFMENSSFDESDNREDEEMEDDI